MALRRFDGSKIIKGDNPFSSNRTAYAGNGVFIKDVERIDNVTFIPSSKSLLAVKIGMLSKIEQIFNEIIDISQPIPVMILADYGQGKSFSIKYIQDRIYSQYVNPIITLSIGNDAQELLTTRNHFTKHLLKCLKRAFDHLDAEIFPNLQELKEQYNLDQIGNTGSYKQAICTFDTVFSTLKVRVFIFVDELERIVTFDTEDQKKKDFLDELKTFAECDNSISLWVAGTTQCKEKIDALGLDYIQRFRLVEYNLFNENETIKYINDKCTQVLKYKGYVPIENSIKKEIWFYSVGNVRFIESICRDLWNISADKGGVRINKIIWKEYLTQKFVEPIKAELGSNLNDDKIQFIIKLLLNKKIGTQVCFKGLKGRRKTALQEYIRDNSGIIVKIGRSYKINSESDVKQRIIERLFQ